MGLGLGISSFLCRILPYTLVYSLLTDGHLCYADRDWPTSPGLCSAATLGTACPGGFLAPRGPCRQSLQQTEAGGPTLLKDSALMGYWVLTWGRGVIFQHQSCVVWETGGSISALEEEGLVPQGLLWGSPRLGQLRKKEQIWVIPSFRFGCTCVPCLPQVFVSVIKSHKQTNKH